MIRRISLAGLLALAVAAPTLGQGTSSTREPAKAEPAKQPEAKPTTTADKLVYVKMSTTAGDIVIELNETRAPATVKNFLAYVDKDFYSGTIFHRVMSNFMIQGGGFTKDGVQKKTEPGVKNEWKNGLKNSKYTISMARIGGNPDSGTSQFFINVRDNDMLDRPQGDGAAYAVFGKVVDGVDTVEKIKSGAVVADVRGEVSKPKDPVVINSVKKLTDDEVSKWKEKGKAPATPAAPSTPEKKDEPKKDDK